MIKTERIYKDLASYYDIIYSKKDYRKESEFVRKIIDKYKESDGRQLLEIGCGTGNHIKYLNKHYDCTATDVNKKILDVAKNNVEGVRFKVVDMTRFDLRKKYDIIICLFSVIGYATTIKDLRQTLRNFADHLKAGGILIIEPWFSKKNWIDGYTHLATYESKDIRIARMTESARKKDLSIFRDHYLIAEKGRIRYFTDTHELLLSENKQLIRIMQDNNLKARYMQKGIFKQRGLLIGVKKW